MLDNPEAFALFNKPGYVESVFTALIPDNNKAISISKTPLERGVTLKEGRLTGLLEAAEKLGVQLMVTMPLEGSSSDLHQIIQWGIGRERPDQSDDPDGFTAWNAVQEAVTFNYPQNDREKYPESVTVKLGAESPLHISHISHHFDVHAIPEKQEKNWIMIPELQLGARRSNVAMPFRIPKGTKVNVVMPNAYSSRDQ